MKKQISGKIFTGSADNLYSHNSLSMSVGDCEGSDELKRLYTHYGRELIESFAGAEFSEAYFCSSGEVFLFEGVLDCDSEEVTITSCEGVSI